MANAQKWGGVQKKMTAKSTTGAQARLPVTAVQPINVGTAPAAPPMTMFCFEVRLSQSV